MVGLGDAGDLVVEVCRDMIVEKVDKVLDNQVRGPRLLGLANPLVDPEDVHDLVGEIVFRADS